MATWCSAVRRSRSPGRVRRALGGGQPCLRMRLLAPTLEVYATRCGHWAPSAGQLSRWQWGGTGWACAQSEREVCPPQQAGHDHTGDLGTGGRWQRGLWPKKDGWLSGQDPGQGQGRGGEETEGPAGPGGCEWREQKATPEASGDALFQTRAAEHATVGLNAALGPGVVDEATLE